MKTKLGLLVAGLLTTLSIVLAVTFGGIAFERNMKVESSEKRSSQLEALIGSKDKELIQAQANMRNKELELMIYKKAFQLCVEKKKNESSKSN